MIWILLFTALFTLFSDGSSFLVPKMDKYIKKCVIDKEQEKKALLLLKESKKERKVYLKTIKKLEKEMKLLFHDRESTQDQFDTLFIRITKSRKSYQSKNQEVASQIQNYITIEEWAQIKLLINNDIIKTKRKLDKLSAKAVKSFDKMKANIEKTIKNKEKSDQAVMAMNEFQKSIEETYQNILKEILNENSVQYKYGASKTELTKFQSDINNEMGKVLKSNAQLHFSIVKTTTEEEWKKLHKKIKMFY